MASRIAKTPLVQLQRHLAAQAAPAAAVKKPADGIEVSDFILWLTQKESAWPRFQM